MVETSPAAPATRNQALVRHTAKGLLSATTDTNKVIVKLIRVAHKHGAHKRQRAGARNLAVVGERNDTAQPTPTPLLAFQPR